MFFRFSDFQILLTSHFQIFRFQRFPIFRFSDFSSFLWKSKKCAAARLSVEKPRKKTCWFRTLPVFCWYCRATSDFGFVLEVWTARRGLRRRKLHRGPFWPAVESFTAGRLFRAAMSPVQRLRSSLVDLMQRLGPRHETPTTKKPRRGPCGPAGESFTAAFSGPQVSASPRPTLARRWSEGAKDFAAARRSSRVECKRCGFACASTSHVVAHSTS